MRVTKVTGYTGNGNSQGSLSCQVCGRAIGRPPCRRDGDALKFCGLKCSGIARRVVHPDELTRIVAARSLRITWPTIAAELGCSVNSVQRAVRRAQAPLRLPAWLEREERNHG
jgi:hypothetical protein